MLSIPVDCQASFKVIFMQNQSISYKRVVCIPVAQNWHFPHIWLNLTPQLYKISCIFDTVMGQIFKIWPTVSQSVQYYIL